jgi:hypothetical protein
MVDVSAAWLAEAGLGALLSAAGYGWSLGYVMVSAVEPFTTFSAVDGFTANRLVASSSLYIRSVTTAVSNAGNFVTRRTGIVSAPAPSAATYPRLYEDPGRLEYSFCSNRCRAGSFGVAGLAGSISAYLAFAIVCEIRLFCTYSEKGSLYILISNSWTFN